MRLDAQAGLVKVSIKDRAAVGSPEIACFWLTQGRWHAAGPEEIKKMYEAARSITPDEISSLFFEATYAPFKDARRLHGKEKSSDGTGDSSSSSGRQVSDASRGFAEEECLSLGVHRLFFHKYSS